MKSLVLIAALMLGIVSATAATLDEAKSLYSQGRYAEALPLMQEQYKKSPKNGSINHWLGVCLYKTGNSEGAVKYLEYAQTRKVVESSLYLSLIAFDNYDFEEADDQINNYISALADAKKPLPEQYEAFVDQVKAARSMLEHVEKITIIDSLVVDKEEFFRAYRISDPAGTLAGTEVLPHDRPAVPTSVYIPESGDRMMWAAPDSTGTLRLQQTIRLIDSNWEQYETLSDVLNNGGDANYPYMLNDGTTLYYACNGEGSVGGYDIYMTRRDSDTGEFLQPQNMGMPYNSPFDDYLLVIDEYTGVGWWATDRNQIEGKVTIYVFIPKEMRENYDVDDDNLLDYAKVTDIRNTWESEQQVEDYIRRILSIERTPAKKAKSFEFSVAKGVVYNNIHEATTSQGRQLLKEYLDLEAEIKAEKEELADLRRQYHEADREERALIRPQILSLERRIDKDYHLLEETANAVRIAEQ